MSRVLLTLPGGSVSINTAVIKDVVETLKRKTGFPEDGEVDLVSQDDSQRDRNSLNEETPEVRTAYRNKIRIKHAEQIKDTQILQGLKSVSFSKPLVEDEKLGLKVCPLYLTTKVDLELTFKFKNLTSLEGWVQRLAILEKMRPLSYELDIRYNYAFPKDLGVFVKHIYSLRELNAGYGDTMEEYVDSIIKTPTVIRSNQSGSYSIDAVNELQRGVVGYFEAESFYNTKTIDRGLHEVTATFSFDYDRLIALSVDFPIIVHNKFIEERFIHEWLSYKDPLSLGEERKEDGRIVGLPPVKREKRYKGDGGERLVDFDDFFPDNTYADTQTVLLFPIQVVATDLHDIVNLNDIPIDKLPERIKTYILDHPDQIKEFLSGPYLVEVFGIGDEQIRTGYTIDTGLNLRSVLPMNLRHRYYIRIAMITDHVRLPNTVIKGFLEDAEDTLNAMHGIAPNLTYTQDEQPYTLHSPRGTFVTVESYNKILRLLPGTNKDFKALKGNARVSVMNTNVIARRR